MDRIVGVRAVHLLPLLYEDQVGTQAEPVAEIVLHGNADREAVAGFVAQVVRIPRIHVQCIAGIARRKADAPLCRCGHGDRQRQAKRAAPEQVPSEIP